MVDEAFLLLESDLFYEERALDAVLACPDADVLLTSGPTGATDEVWVEASADGRLVAMSKDDKDLEHVTGELVGIVHHRLLADAGRRLVHDGLHDARVGEPLGRAHDPAPRKHHAVRHRDAVPHEDLLGQRLVAGRAQREVGAALVVPLHLVDVGWANQVREADELEELTPPRRGAGKDDSGVAVHGWGV